MGHRRVTASKSIKITDVVKEDIDDSLFQCVTLE